MPIVRESITPVGPTVDLLIGVSAPRADALRAAGKPVPTPIQIRGLLDTGASGTCIDAACLIPLQLTPTGQVPIHTPSTGQAHHVCDLYDISLVLLFPGVRWTFPMHPVIGTDFSMQPIQALIGRDVLAQSLLVYDGPAGYFSLAF